MNGKLIEQKKDKRNENGVQSPSPLIPLPVGRGEGRGEGFVESLLPLRTSIGTLNGFAKLRRSAMSIAANALWTFVKLHRSGMFIRRFMERAAQLGDPDWLIQSAYWLTTACKLASQEVLIACRTPSGSPAISTELTVIGGRGNGVFQRRTIERVD